MATLAFTAACGTGELKSSRKNVTYNDVDIDAITAPSSSVRGARDFLYSGEGTANGEPLYIAWLNENPDWDVSLRAASELVNRELDGVNGRPIEILSCGGSEELRTCAARVSAMAPIITLIGETTTAHESIRQALGNAPAIGVDPADPQSWNDPLTHHFTLGVTGVLRAATTWAATRPAEEAYDAILILAPYAQALEGTLDALKTAQVDTLILSEAAASDAEDSIAKALDKLGDAPERRTLVVNSLGQNGCVSLARTVDPRVASLSWGDIDVITTGACAGKQVHDELGDWPPNWYHVGAGPDLQIYELDPQVRVYRDRIIRYGKPDADWTAANSLPFGTLLTALRIVTPVINDNPIPTGNDVNRAVAAYTGPGFMGMPEHLCGFDSDRTSLCVRHARVYIYTGQRDWLNLVGEPFPLTD